ncbi:MAG: MgtC/SapB family protein [Candidatus Brocadiia bacterium]
MLPLAVVGEIGFGPTVLRLVLATVLAGAIGLERESHGRPAGLRTHIMVCLGACLVMLATRELARLWPSEEGLRIDPARLAQGVVTGIGFIGAGAILRLKRTTRGLTTAACIWFVAALGVVVGVGAYVPAVAGTVLALFVLHALNRLEKCLQPDRYRELVVVAERRGDVFGPVRAVLEELGVREQTYDYADDVQGDELRVTFSVKYSNDAIGEMLLRRLREVPGVRSIEWRFPPID